MKGKSPHPARRAGKSAQTRASSATSGQSHRRRPPAPTIDLVIENLRIERIVGDGLGIGFDDDGLAVFVPRTAPGDLIRARVTRRQNKVYHAEIEEIVEPSPIRIEPRVPDYDASGGLDFQHLAYEDQIRIKSGMIADSLRRIAKIASPPDIDMTPSPNEWHYRSRAEFQIDHATGAVGYFAANSHRVVDVEESPILTLETQALLTTLRDDVQAGLVPKTNREYRAVTGDLGSVLEPTSTPKSRTVVRDLGGETYRYPAECFFQANLPVTAAILENVLGIADEIAGDPGLALDLYCGVGLFTVPLARRFRRTIGVESFKPAADAAETNLTNAGITNPRIATIPVEHWLAGDRSPLGRVAFAVFDPPRAGAGQETIDRLARMSPMHIAAVSCDPATFARDTRDLLAHGYELVRVTGYDMFPQTHHVEIVGHLVRIAP